MMLVLSHCHVEACNFVVDSESHILYDAILHFTMNVVTNVSQKYGSSNDRMQLSSYALIQILRFLLAMCSAAEVLVICGACFLQTSNWLCLEACSPDPPT